MPVPWNQTDPACYITHCAASAFYFSRIGQFGSPTIFHIPDKSKKNVMTKRNKSALFLLGTWEWGGRGIYFFTFFLLRCALMRTMRSMRALWIVFETMWPSDTCDEAGLLFVCKDRVRRLCEWLTLWATVLAPVALLARRCRVRYAGPWPTLWYY